MKASTTFSMRVPARYVQVGDVVEDDCGEARAVVATESVGDEVVLRATSEQSSLGDALICSKDYRVTVVR